MKENIVNRKEIIGKTKKWVERFVIGQGLCPFAKVPFDEKKVRFFMTDSDKTEACLVAFWNEIILLKQKPAIDISNTILIFSHAFSSFRDYLDFYYLTEDLLMEENENEHFQLASFHPNYQFAGTSESDVTNYTNRSPYPMIHILRIIEVEKAIASHSNIDSVPENNMEKMRALGKDGIEKILDSL